MEKSIITTGKTLDLAIEAALKQLGLDRDSVSVEVLENAKTGFLGFGACPAKVKVTYEAPEEESGPKPALSSASRSKPKKYTPPVKAEPAPAPAPVQKAPVQAPAKAEPAKAPAAPKEKQENRPAERKQQERRNSERKPQEKKPARQQPKQEKTPVEYKPAEPGSTEEKIEVFIKGLLEHMGSDAVPHAVKTGDENYTVDLVGENLGMLIGRRGDTLDAIQHLTNYAINREAGKHARVSVDAENYRQKREESLQRLAAKVADKVVKYRRNITLEPMNAYERHVIHAALQDTPGVTTFSTGTEPNRRIVVSYSREKSASR